MAKPLPSNPLFAGIEDSKTVRKELLEASKAVVHTLIQHEKYLEIRARKKAKITELNNAINKLIENNKKLHQLLPQTQEAPKPIEKKKELLPQKKTVAEKKSRLDELKDELSKFEEKLADLD